MFLSNRIAKLMIITLDKITKRYGSFVANEDISFSVKPGEVHCLLGENGAGKTTLMNVIYGLSPADGGQIFVDENPVTFTSPKDAINAGVGMVHQHFMLIPAFTVAENIILGQEPTRAGDRLDLKAARRRVQEISMQFGLGVDPDAKIEDLPVGAQQRVEIAKVLYRAADVMIFDEPTAVLTPQEVEGFFNIVRGLRAAGKAILLITHKLNEVMEIADKITVLRHGRVIAQADPAQSSPQSLANMMVGRPVTLQVERQAARTGQPVLELRDVFTVDETSMTCLSDINLKVRAGEVVGIAGVHGNGQTELIDVAAGLLPAASGSVWINDRYAENFSARGRHELGLAHIPEDRTHCGLALSMSIVENSALNSYYERRFSKAGQVDWPTIKDTAQDLVRQFDVRTKDVELPVSSLSGGNQQKVVIAREMSRPIKALIAAQPTRGVDVGSIEYIHKRIVEARDQGIGVLLVSTELDEVLALSDRVLVLFQGRIVAEFEGRPDNREMIGLAMAGIAPAHKEMRP
ncbi:ABC transporter ATP-binding protein (plasmid) [Rhizobium sp. CB3060]|uniref:ABC transporter ATP-binding protein n=1 Tax=Rhizobium sp. CB3060 TaxID=3138255 RepID=UPI0021A8F245|nr:ABC transporter ATP-binding protein [Rhizobium tropici]UWU25501.1 ABC transporter ATP-binding protein [Rhizobium tropici]